jgi:hypothetical protein
VLVETAGEPRAGAEAGRAAPLDDSIELFRTALDLSLF